MALKMNFREVTPEDTEILRMIALRNGKAEDYLCCDVTNEDGVTQTTWYSKADVALWGEDYIRAHTTMKYSDYSGWIIILDTIKVSLVGELNTAKGGTDQYASGTPARKQQTNLRPCGREKRVSLLGSKPYR